MATIHLITGSEYVRHRDTNTLGDRQWMWYNQLETGEAVTLHHSADSEPLARITKSARSAGYVVQKLVSGDRELPDANRWAIEGWTVEVGWRWEQGKRVANAVLLGPLLVGNGMYADGEDNAGGPYAWAETHGGITMQATTFDEDAGAYNTCLTICMPDQPYHGMSSLVLAHASI